MISHTRTKYVDKKKLEDHAEPFVRNIILAEFANVKRIVRTTPDSPEDLAGIDYIVTFNNNMVKRVDVKARGKDYKQNDVVLETYSNVEEETVGWTLDNNKKTDLVIFVCVDTGAYQIMPFAQLLRIFQTRNEDWRSIFRLIRQKTSDNRPGRKRDVYTSEGMIVPYSVLIDEIKQLMYKEQN